VGTALIRSKGLIVVKLSGSLFFSTQFDSVVEAFKQILEAEKTFRLVLVSGGGSMARQYIDIGRKLGADQASLDELGIQVSRLNAMVLVSAFGDLAYPKVPTNLDGVVEAIEVVGKRVVVVGGLHPGQSTNAVAALIAEKVRAERFINATDVDGVYTKDPQKSKTAKKLHSVTPKQLERILGSESMQAGGYDLMDPVALKLVERSKIPTIVTKCDPKILIDIVLRRKDRGTKITFA
jgi:uridylate kinase